MEGFGSGYGILYVKSLGAFFTYGSLVSNSSGNVFKWIPNGASVKSGIKNDGKATPATINLELKTSKLKNDEINYGTNTIRDMCWCNEQQQLLALGDYGNIWTSYDGENWEERKSLLNLLKLSYPNNLISFSNAAPSVVAYSDIKKCVCMLNRGGDALISSDFENWNVIAKPENLDLNVYAQNINGKGNSFIWSKILKKFVILDKDNPKVYTLDIK